MLRQGWRWATLAVFASAFAPVVLAQQPGTLHGPQIFSRRASAAPTVNGPQRLPSTKSGQPSTDAPQEDAAAIGRPATPAGYEWVHNGPRLAETEGESVDFVNTAAARREAEIEARLAALELSLADEKKKDDKKKSPWYEVGSDLSMSASWKDGVTISTKNKDFQLHVGGRAQFDASFYSADPNVYNGGGLGPGGVFDPSNAAGKTTAAQLRDSGIGNQYGNGVDFRRARIKIDGTMYDQIDWACQFDFVNSANINGVTRSVVAPTDLWWTFRELPYVQNIRIGNHKAAIGFEHLVSSRFLPFMERSYNQDTFYGGLYNGFLPGLSIYGTYGDDEIGTWNAGVFKPTNNVFVYNTGNRDYQVTTRLTRLLHWEEDGRSLLHVGGSFQQASTTSHNIGGGALNNLGYTQFRTRDAIRAGLSGDWPTPANIILAGSNQQTVNGELVGVNGPWTFQAEYLVNVLHDAQFERFDTGLGQVSAPGNLQGFPIGPVQPTAVYHGGYAQVFCFLTGEHDHYEKKNGCFGRVKPYENFFRVGTCNGICSGWGAWQVGARYNYLCLNDGFLNGGALHDITAGLNWFLNPNMKIQLNYMLTYRDAGFGLNPTLTTPVLPVQAKIGNAGDGFIHGIGMRLAHDW